MLGRSGLNSSALAAALFVPLFLPVSGSAQQATRLEARPATMALEVGEARAIEVVALDAAGTEIEAAVRLVGPRDALAVSEGTVTALTAGEHELVATLVTGAGATPVTLRIPVTVSWPVIESVVVDASPGRLYTGATLGHSATARHADGSVRTDAVIRWTSSDPRVATVDRFGGVTGIAPGSVMIVAEAEGARGSREYRVEPFSGSALEIRGGVEVARTGDVLHFDAVVTEPSGRVVDDVPVNWSHSYRNTDYAFQAGSAPGQVVDGAFVADHPGVHTIVASAGPLTARRTIEVVDRDVVQELEVLGVGRQPRIRTTDFWVFEGVDGRDYVITGSKVADGHAFIFDVTDPSNPIKTDSVQVDARAINDVKVSPDSRYATMTREGASSRRNGVVILDLADPAHPVIASEVTERLTGGVHNAFPTEGHVFALSAGDKYVIIDVEDIRNPRIVGEYDHPDSRVHDVWVHDGLAFTAEWGTGLVVTDVGNGRWGGSVENPVLVSTLPLPTGGTHAAFPYFQEETGKYYVFVGDEIMSRNGLAWSGYPGSMGSYSNRYDPETGQGGIPLTTQGYIQVIDFTDPENPEMVARYEVPEYGTHNIWVEDDVLYQAYYEGGVRMVDVSGELMGNLYTQRREIAVFKSVDPEGYTSNATMVWSAMPFKGHIFFTDTNSGLWAVKIQPRARPVS